MPQPWATENNGVSALVIQKGYPRATRGTDGLWQLEFLYWANKSTALSLIPSHEAAPPEPWNSDYSGLKLKEVSISPSNSPYFVWVTLIYQDPESSGSTSSRTAGDVIQESRAAFQEVAIEDSRLGLSQSQIDSYIAQGVTSKSVYTLTYTRTEYFNSFTFTEANMVDMVGRIDTPTGVTTPTANAWLQSGRSVRKSSDSLYEVTDEWTYDKGLWDTTIYT